jgi:hypothetical protein
MKHPKVQHYVPQFLLAGFEANPGSRIVNVYDKQRGTTFSANIRNVAAEKAFYDVEVGDLTLTFEPSLGELEGRGAELITAIGDREQIGFLSDGDRAVLAAFVLAQNMRTRQFLETVHEGGIALAAALDRMEPGTSKAMGFSADRERSRVLALDLLKRSGDFIPHILEKAWGLYEAPPEHPFWIGDHPIVMENNVLKSEVRGTIGLAVRGIEIYLPISPRFCLGFVCPTLKDRTDQLYRQSLWAKAEHGIEAATHDQVGALRDGFEFGFPIPSRAENVEYVNSLQVIYSERFVFSSQKDFTMIEEMIANSPELRRGPRPQVE